MTKIISVIQLKGGAGMKKTLLLAALLLSSAAQADTFFCTSESMATIFAPPTLGYSNHLSENDDTTIVVDSSKGYRHSEFEGYSGDCETSGAFLVCSFESEYGQGTIAIATSELSFSYIDHTFGTRLTSRVGNCVKA
jgi:hypothetical protein